MDELNALRRDRCLAYCCYNGWSQLQLINGFWHAIPPGATEAQQLPAIAYKCPFPSDVPEGS